jgi:Response regulator containing a CheY-like receiver domain and an HTH DNA-binding domain
MDSHVSASYVWEISNENPPEMTVTVVEESPSLRESLMRLINETPGMVCLCALSSGQAALEKLPQRRPDVVVMDAEMAGMSALDCLVRLKPRLGGVPILIWSVSDDQEQILRCLRAGAAGYLLKSSAPAQLLAAIREAHESGAAMSSQAIRRIVQHFQSEGSVARERRYLSERETDVIELLARGYIYKEIADQLHISAETVRTHVKNICGKLQAKSRVEAVAKHRLACAFA